MQQRDNRLLEVSNLSVSYGTQDFGLRVVRDVSFTLGRGEVLGVAGESGSGKSTLAFAITRLLRQGGRVTSGSILWFGQHGQPVDLLSADDTVLRRIRWADISIVFQSAMSSLNPVLSLGAQIDDVIRAHQRNLSGDERRAKITELLRMVGIPASRASAYPHELSGGMRQRAVIAIALALSPQLVILDEPTTALDVVMQRQVLNENNGLRRELGFAMIFITHDLSLLIEMADQIVVMYAGAIVEKASAKDLYESPQHPYSDGLLHSFPKLQGPRMDLLGIPGNAPNPASLPSGCSFHPRCGRVMPECIVTNPALVARLSHGPSSARTVACLLFDKVGEETNNGDGD